MPEVNHQYLVYFFTRRSPYSIFDVRFIILGSLAAFYNLLLFDHLLELGISLRLYLLFEVYLRWLKTPSNKISLACRYISNASSAFHSYTLGYQGKAYIKYYQHT